MKPPLIVRKLDEALEEGYDADEAIGHVARLLGISRMCVLRVYCTEKRN